MHKTQCILIVTLAFIFTSEVNYFLLLTKKSSTISLFTYIHIYNISTVFIQKTTCAFLHKKNLLISM